MTDSLIISLNVLVMIEMALSLNESRFKKKKGWIYCPLTKKIIKKQKQKKPMNNRCKFKLTGSCVCVLGDVGCVDSLWVFLPCLF